MWPCRNVHRRRHSFHLNHRCLEPCQSPCIAAAQSLGDGGRGGSEIYSWLIVVDSCVCRYFVQECQLTTLFCWCQSSVPRALRVASCSSCLVTLRSSMLPATPSARPALPSSSPRSSLSSSCTVPARSATRSSLACTPASGASSSVPWLMSL